MKSTTFESTARAWGKSLGCIIKAKNARKLDIQPDEKIRVTVRVLRD